jgi:hypothetical protein
MAFVVEVFGATAQQPPVCGEERSTISFNPDNRERRQRRRKAGHTPPPFIFHPHY